MKYKIKKIYYFGSEIIKIERSCLNGRKHGIIKAYFIDGSRNLIKQLKQDILNGPRIKFKY